MAGVLRKATAVAGVVDCLPSGRLPQSAEDELPERSHARLMMTSPTITASRRKSHEGVPPEPPEVEV